MKKFIIYPLSTQGKVKRGESKKSKLIPTPPCNVGLKSLPIPAPPILRDKENSREEKRRGAS